MSWKPFGLTLTYGEFNELVTWYINKNTSDPLNTKEGTNYAKNLYSENRYSWTD